MLFSYLCSQSADNFSLRRSATTAICGTLAPISKKIEDLNKKKHAKNIRYIFDFIKILTKPVLKNKLLMAVIFLKINYNSANLIDTNV